MGEKVLLDPYGALTSQNQQAALINLANRELLHLTGTFGANCTSFDLSNLKGDTNGPIKIVINGISVGSAANPISLRVNGSTANLSRYGWGGQTETTPGFIPGTVTGAIFDLNAAAAAVGKKFSLFIECKNPKSGNLPQQIDVTVQTIYSNTGPQYVVSKYTFLRRGSATGNEIDKIGIEGTQPLDLAAASDWEIWRTV